MKFSTRSRYGLRAMIELALHYQDKPVFLKDIAEHQNISMKYLDHIVSSLKARGLIIRVKDGYVLGRAPSEINCAEIVNILEGSFNPVVCLDSPSFCNKSDKCEARKVWEKVGSSLKETLESFTLEDLIDHNAAKPRKNSKIKKGNSHG
jgi:Rrf2 family cysteine metabolism transcriptional repressor